MKNLLLENVEYKIETTNFGVWRRFVYPTGAYFAEFKSHAAFWGLPLLHYTRGKCPETGKQIKKPMRDKPSKINWKQLRSSIKKLSLPKLFSLWRPLAVDRHRAKSIASVFNADTSDLSIINLPDHIWRLTYSPPEFLSVWTGVIMGLSISGVCVNLKVRRIWERREPWI